MTRPFRRRVLYLPGYDPIPPRRYREIYHREGRIQAEISGYRLSFAKRRDPVGFGWLARGEFGARQTEVEFEVLTWGDIVQGSMGQSILATYAQLFRTAWIYIGSGALFQLMRLRKGPVIAALYPVVMLLVQGLIALSLGLIAALGLAQLGGWILGIPVGFVLFYAVLKLFQRQDGRLFAYYLMHDYAFTAHLHGAYPPALETRIAYFADRLRAAMQGDWDEVLVVGHSSGAYLAVSVVADVLRAGHAGPRISLLTLGQVVPMASFLPEAGRLRADLHDIAADDRVFWVDVTAPGDACAFALCDPVAVTGVAPTTQHGPLVLSAAFTKTLSPERQKALRWHWFRIHFQYLHAFDRPGDYDYFAITAGPVTLAERFDGRAHSPGRIVSPVNHHRRMVRQ